MADAPLARADALALALYRALQQGDAHAAVSRAPEALEAAVGRPKLEARLHAWLSQAHLQLGAPREARAALRAALRAARSTGDDAEVQALLPLQERVLASAAAAAAPAPPPPRPAAGGAVAAVDAGDPDLGAQVARAAIAAAAAAPAPSTPSTPSGRAVAAFDAGDPDFGAQLARAAIAAAREAADPREEVIALLALARHPDHTEASIRAAADVADRANDFNLVTAVAHAARSAGVTFAPKVF